MQSLLHHTSPILEKGPIILKAFCGKSMHHIMLFFIYDEEAKQQQCALDAIGKAGSQVRQHLLAIQTTNSLL